MYIKKIVWINYNCKEAMLIVSDKVFEIICFSHPCNYNQGEIVNEPLECLCVYDVKISNNGKFILKKINDIFQYFINGKLVDAKQGIVLVGEIIIHIDERVIPKDIENNVYIQFVTNRIDLW